MTGQDVRPGQVWVPRLGSHIHTALRVTRVENAAVWTDHGGRTTVFALQRRYRLQEAPS